MRTAYLHETCTPSFINFLHINTSTRVFPQRHRIQFSYLVYKSIPVHRRSCTSSSSCSRRSWPETVPVRVEGSRVFHILWSGWFCRSDSHEAAVEGYCTSVDTKPKHAPGETEMNIKIHLEFFVISPRSLAPVLLLVLMAVFSPGSTLFNISQKLQLIPNWLKLLKEMAYIPETR